MKKSICIIWVFTFMIFACNNNSKHEHPEENSSRMNDTPSHHENGQIIHSDAVKLDNGKKWIANKETTDGIRKMTELAADIPADAKLEDYHSLNKKMENEFNLVLKRCTMKDEAHNQLHNYLMPMMPMIEDLKSQDINIAKNALNKLKKHFDEYNEYFH